MSLVKQFVCDCGCGAVRGESNHWLLIFVGAGQFVVEPWSTSAACDDAEHAAGSECVHRLLNAWMEQRREK